MVFCNMIHKKVKLQPIIVTILILIDGFLQYDNCLCLDDFSCVTILILIDGFLQYKKSQHLERCCESHNPYFNRWFSAILKNF